MGRALADMRDELVGWRNLLVFRRQETPQGRHLGPPWRSLLLSFLVVVATTVAVIVLDRVTGPRQSVLPLYAVLVAWTAWSLGLLPGLLVALGVSSTWLVLNAIAIDGVGVWNAIARFGALSLLAYLAAMHRLVSAALTAVARFASTDILTGALNRRALAAAVLREVARCRRERAPLSVLYFDLDRFKEVNDSEGHAAGDALLAAVAQTTQDLLRTTDVLARVGGDEFVVLLPAAALDEARRVAERIRAGVEAVGCRTHAVTASIGLVTWYSLPATPDALLERADHAMYEAKRQGGNRVVANSVAVEGAATLESASHLVRALERSRDGGSEATRSHADDADGIVLAYSAGRRS